jgi:hypothetical protein
MTDIRRQEVARLASMLADQTTQAAIRAMKRYPDDRESRLADEAAQLRMLSEIVVDQLRAMTAEEQ